MKKHLSFFGLIEAGTYVLFLISLLSLGGEFYYYFELLSHFKLQYFIVSLLLLLVVGVYKKARLMCIAGICVLLNGYFVLPNYGIKAADASVKVEQEIKIILSNVYIYNTDYDKLLKYVHQEAPDILVLQEIDAEWVTKMEVFKERYPFQVVEDREAGFGFGIGIWSTLPISAEQVHYYVKQDIPSLEVTIPVANQAVSLLTTHPLPPVNRQYYNWRNDQLTQVAARSREIEQAKILVGDLNITPWSSDYRPLVAGTGLRSVREGLGIYPTWPTHFPIVMIPIDHLFVSEHFLVKEVATGPNIGSDHLPLMVVLGLKSG